jgi:predicted DNA-binding mobile mystery protein A
MDTQRLQIEQLEHKLEKFHLAADSVAPPQGWVRFIRQSIGMSLRQLGNRLGMSPQAVRDLEMREAEGKVTLTALGNAARSLDMKLVYAIIPAGCTVSDLIRLQAQRLATEAIRRTSVSMSLEDQAIGRAEVLHEIEELTDELVRHRSRSFWDQPSSI